MASIEAALVYFDGLAPVAVEDLIGAWRGEDLPTGNPLDGLLKKFGWHGKRFDGPDDVHPLVFDAGRGRRVSVNPAFTPIGLMVRRPRLLHTPLAVGAFRIVRPLVTTRLPKARLRLTEYRGVVTATMCYDRLPIHDAFRRIDDDTLLGAMDLRGLDQPFMFVLHREDN
jgi:hypothetical protein